MEVAPGADGAAGETPTAPGKTAQLRESAGRQQQVEARLSRGVFRQGDLRGGIARPALGVNPDDHRRVLVAATPSGAELLARAHPKVVAGIEAMRSRLTHKEQTALRLLLEKLAPEDELSPERA